MVTRRGATTRVLMTKRLKIALQNEAMAPRLHARQPAASAPRSDRAHRHAEELGDSRQLDELVGHDEFDDYRPTTDSRRRINPRPIDPPLASARNEEAFRVSWLHFRQLIPDPTPDAVQSLPRGALSIIVDKASDLGWSECFR